MSEISKSADTKLKSLSFPYKDILDLPVHKSKKRDPLPIEARAGQFMPFAALTGFDEVVDETARRTDEEKELSEDQQDKIDRVLSECVRLQDTMPLVEITYFIPDYIKGGGIYKTVTEGLARVDIKNCKVVLLNGQEITINSIFNIEMV